MGGSPRGRGHSSWVTPESCLHTADPNLIKSPSDLLVDYQEDISQPQSEIQVSGRPGRRHGRGRSKASSVSFFLCTAGTLCKSWYISEALVSICPTGLCRERSRVTSPLPPTPASLSLSPSSLSLTGGWKIEGLVGAMAQQVKVPATKPRPEFDPWDLPG